MTADTSSTCAPPGPWAALGEPKFLTLWGAAAVANIGLWMQNMAVPFVAYELTDSTLWLSVTVAATFIPAFVTSPWSGALCDRYSPRRVMVAAAAAQMVSVGCLAALWALGFHRIDVLLAFVIPFNLGGGLMVVAWYSMVPHLVPVAMVSGAVRLASLQNNLARALGPAVAGVVLARWGPGASFASTAAAYAVLLTVLVLLPPTAVALSERGSVLRDLRDGMRYTRRHLVPRQATMTIAVFSATAYAVVQLAPVIADDVLEVGSDGYSRLLLAYGLGALAGTALLAVGGERIPRSKAILGGLSAGVVGTVAVGFAQDMVLGLGAFALIGWSQTTLSVSQNTAIIVQSDERLRGRVVSLYLMAVIGALPVGVAVLGALADRFPLERVILGAAVALAFHSALAARRSQVFRIFDGLGPVDDRRSPVERRP